MPSVQGHVLGPIRSNETLAHTVKPIWAASRNATDSYDCEAADSVRAILERIGPRFHRAVLAQVAIGVQPQAIDCGERVQLAQVRAKLPGHIIDLGRREMPRVAEWQAGKRAQQHI